MNDITGVIYPNNYQNDQLNESMLSVVKGYELPQIHQHKNVALVSFQSYLFSDKRKGYDIAYEGNIYNINFIRQQLINHGYSFYKETTAEILLRAYEMWKIEFIKEILGNFVIALIDYNKQKLFLIQDHIGSNHIYWFYGYKHFLFSSNLKSLLLSGLVSQSIDSESIAAYLSLGYVPQDISPIEKVNKLLPGYYLQYNMNKEISIHPHWSYSSCFLQQKTDYHNAITNLPKLLQKSVNLRLESSEQVFCLLDNNITSIYLAHLLKKHKNTCFITSLDNTDLVSTYSKLCKDISPQVINTTDIDLNNSLVPILWHIGEPIANPEIINFWNICKKTSAKTLFASPGSDIIFGMNKRYFSDKMCRSYSSFFYHTLIKLLKVFNDTFAFKYLSYSQASPKMLKYLSSISIFDKTILKAASPPLYRFFRHEVFIQKFYRMQQYKLDSIVFSYFDVKTLLTDYILLPFNQIAKSYGLNYHIPFFDCDIMESLASIYGNQNLLKSQNDIIAQDLIKTLFNEESPYVPLKDSSSLSKWLNTPLMTDVLQLLHKGMLAESGIISKKWIKQATNKKIFHRHLHQIWAILCLEIWYRLFIHKTLPTSVPNITVQELLS